MSERCNTRVALVLYTLCTNYAGRKCIYTKNEYILVASITVFNVVGFLFVEILINLCL
jgi:hypothetical protein